MRTVLLILLIAVTGTSALAFHYRQEFALQTQRTGDLTSQVDRLLAEVETQTRQRVEQDYQVQQLTREMSRAESRIEALNRELTETAELIDPDYRQVEERLRQRYAAQYREQLADALAAQESAPASLNSVITQLSRLTTEERVALLGVQGQYGAFLDSLDVDAGRKDQITQALVDLNLAQADARRDLIRQQLPPQEMRREMMALMGPEAVRESLAYDLTDEELAAFDAFQQDRRVSFNAFTTTVDRNGEPGLGVMMLRSDNGEIPEVIQQGGDYIINTSPGVGQAERVIIRSAPAGINQ